ncbi:TIR domain-containing protein [Micromonospora sp. WMMD1076]|uniref:TIR domain-containing protein n=1 Tax=Micromonospora sp. WMMD1076 TaxID=3016103 RepID=UPI00249C0537|nr:TIR domain-containing protein [Micromonospora sp. WMMD1076]WFF08718.1 TIR domain-containing protein [Micromonospora sp. WMMD1076]
MRDHVGVSIPLTIVNDGGKRLDYSPADVSIGIVRLGRWQIHPVRMDRGLFDRSSAYLIKMNWGLELEPDLATMPWLEIGLHLDSDERATVLDAVPRSSNTPQAASSYTINRHLELVPATSSDEAQIHTPAIEESINQHDTGTSSVRWRYSTRSRFGIQPGSRAAWILLLAPEGRTQQPCRLAVRYDLRPDDDTPYLPTQQSATFTITLDDSPPEGAISPLASAPRRTEPVGNTRSAFICYAHESPQFKADVKRLADVLLGEGLDVHLDQFDGGPRKEWGNWARKNFDEQEFTLVIASKAMRDVGDGLITDGRHSGLQSELTALKTYYQRYPEWQRYVLPVILPEQSKDGIPIFLGPESWDYYEVDDYTPRGVGYLTDAIRKTEPRTFRLK